MNAQIHDVKSASDLMELASGKENIVFFTDWYGATPEKYGSGVILRGLDDKDRRIFYRGYENFFTGYYRTDLPSITWTHLATTTPPQEYDLSIDSSVFENYDNSIWLKSSYRKSQTGIVTVTIMGQFVTDLHSDSDQTLATIPAGFRPKGYMRRIGSTFAGAVAQIDVSNSGSIYVRGSAKANDWLCCELSFVASD